LSPIGSAVLTFIGYKQTDKHKDRQAKFIYRFIFLRVLNVELLRSQQ